MTTSLNRRSFMTAALAGTVANMAGGLGAVAAHAASAAPHRAANRRTQVPGVYRQSVGAITITAIADGYAMAPLRVVPGVTEQEGASLARAASLAPGDIPIPINTFLVETGDRLVMVDTGFGGEGGGRTGQVWASLAAAGIDPARIDALVLSHGHSDHTAGMRRADGSAAFPNAELFVHAREAAYWTDDGNLARARTSQQSEFDAFRKAIAPYRKRTTLIERDGQEIVPGVRFAELQGHTPGHGGLHIADGDAQHLFWADVIHFPHLQLPRPDLGVIFDVDTDAARRTRRTILERVAFDRLAVSGSHLVFPGFGHLIQAKADGYAFEPSRWQYDL